MMMEAISSSETYVLTRSTRYHFPEDGILHNDGCENLKSYITLTGCTFYRRRDVFLWSSDWVFISQKTRFFIVTAVATWNLTNVTIHCISPIWRIVVSQVLYGCRKRSHTLTSVSKSWRLKAHNAYKTVWISVMRMEGDGLRAAWPKNRSWTTSRDKRHVATLQRADRHWGMHSPYAQCIWTHWGTHSPYAQCIGTHWGMHSPYAQCIWTHWGMHSPYAQCIGTHWGMHSPYAQCIGTHSPPPAGQNDEAWSRPHTHDYCRG
jgi:hypothetical protein